MNDTDKQKEDFLEKKCFRCEKLNARISHKHCCYRRVGTHLKTPNFVLCDVLCKRYIPPSSFEISFYQQNPQQRGDGAYRTNAVHDGEKWRNIARRKQKKGSVETRQKVKVLLKSGIGQGEIAKMCGVSQARISQIKRGM